MRPRRRLVLALAVGAVAAFCGVGASAEEPPVDGAPVLETPLSEASVVEAAVSEAATLAVACGGCHQASGAAIVGLGGRDAEDIAAKLSAYRTEDGETVMHRLARGYSAGDIASLAAYLAGPGAEAAP